MPTGQLCFLCGAEIPIGTKEGLCNQCRAQNLEQTPTPGNFTPTPRAMGGNGQSAQMERLPEAEIQFGSPRGRVFGDYELLQQVGRGGMGVVYKARQISLNRIVALKMVLKMHAASSVALERLRIEAEAAAKLEHPNIVTIFGYGEQDGLPFFTMRYIEGTSLSKIDRAKGNTFLGRAVDKRMTSRQRQKEIAALMSKIARAVNFAHKNGVLHRDLKPGNILIDKDGEPYLADFGIAKLVDEEAPTEDTTPFLGTLSYMAPEQATGQSKGGSTSSDLYSLGAILYELLTGYTPFRAETPIATLEMIRSEPAVDPRKLKPNIDRDLAVICLKCLEKEPALRYATAQDLADDLDRFLNNEPIHARPAGVFTKTQRWVKRSPLAAGLIVSLMIGLALTLFLLNKNFKESTAKFDALAVLQAEIGERIKRFGFSNEPFIELSSEAMAALEGAEAKLRGGPEKRLTAAIVVEENPFAPAMQYASFLRQLESALSQNLKTSVRINLRLYRDQELAASHLASGEIQMTELDPHIFVNSRAKGNDLKLIARPKGADGQPGGALLRNRGIIFARANSGLHSLGQLKGKKIIFDPGNPMLVTYAKAKLVQQGLTSSNVQVILRDKSVSGSGVLQSVLDNRVDAGTDWEDRIQRNAQSGATVVLSRFETPISALVASPTMEVNLLTTLRSVITSLPADALSSLDIAGFESVTEKQLDNFQETLREAEKFDGKGSSTP